MGQNSKETSSAINEKELKKLANYLNTFKGLLLALYAYLMALSTQYYLRSKITLHDVVTVKLHDVTKDMLELINLIATGQRLVQRTNTIDDVKNLGISIDIDKILIGVQNSLDKLKNLRKIKEISLTSKDRASNDQ